MARGNSQAEGGRVGGGVQAWSYEGQESQRQPLETPRWNGRGGGWQMDRKETEMERMLVHRGDPWTPSNKTTVLVSRHAVMSCLKEDETGMSVDFC